MLVRIEEIAPGGPGNGSGEVHFEPRNFLSCLGRDRIACLSIALVSSKEAFVAKLGK